MKYKTNHIPHVKGVGFHHNFHKINETGLQQAYNSEKKLHIDGDTLFIAGTANKQDVWDDISKIPFWGDVRKSQRYKDADDLLKGNPQIKKLVSHSLGGSVGLELQKQKSDKAFDVTTYGAPVVQLSSQKHKRFRHPGDPISAFDYGSITLDTKEFTLDPLKHHSYKGY